MLPDRLSDEDWLAERFQQLTTELHVVTPSDLAEEKRYLPPAAGRYPGPFCYSLTPYLREIVDCFDVDSPIQEVSLMKGVQIGATTGVLENILLYAIAYVAGSSVMLLTADAEMARNRLELNVIPMLQASGLEHLLKSADETNNRKTGKTTRRIEWIGGFAIPYGAQNANKLRSIPIRFLLRDEVDGYPDVVGKDGDPIRLSTDRTASYEEGGRKILNLSTPLVEGQSKIKRLYQQGDQRKYFVHCLKCGFAQELRWRHTNAETGEVTGITWDSDGGNIVQGSVRYLCQECGHPHINDDKARLLAPEYGAEWRPTAVPTNPNHRSYHLSALYSPPGMQSWETCARIWLAAWDVEHNIPRDMGELQVFYNNVLGETFELRGERLTFAAVSSQRRSVYHYGQIPNKWALQYCGSPVLLLTCTVDVHSDNLAVAVFGWCRERRAVLVEYWRFQGDTEQLDNPDTWGRLQTLIEGHQYTADDGKVYGISLTLIDSGYRTDHVYQFAGQYSSGVYPVKGRDVAPKHVRDREFSEFTTPTGIVAYGVTVDFYKDRWSAALRRSWDGQSVQPHGHFNAPMDATDKQLKELTVETKRERIEKPSGKRVGWEWHRPSGASNELWDLLVYANAGLDLIAWNYSQQIGLEFTNWAAFWDACLAEQLFFAV